MAKGERAGSTHGQNLAVGGVEPGGLAELDEKQEAEAMVDL
jgi:hypothetical protein